MESIYKIDRKNGNCEVYKYFDETHNKYLCKKILTTTSNSKLKAFQQEVDALKYINGFPSCLKYYDSKLTSTDKTHTLEIITEFCEKGNLNQYLIKRGENQNYFKNKELFFHFSNFISLFSHLQSKNISHRDIKPENIFIVSDTEFKIGDFGSSTMNLDRNRFTIQGSNFYLSPELREGYEKFLKKIESLYITHNPFKSDVYSLGLVFLFMATLEMITEKFCELKNLDGLLKNKLSMIKNYKIRSVVSIMLTINSEQRPDFIELKSQFLNIIKYPLCSVCLQSCSSNYSYCNSCYSFYHLSCSSTFYCNECEESLIVSCNYCKTQK
ncbi:hypothetical protein SteCoe_23882 [Stentor coeruleus]|uniref:Protein kinase domain-containing protein n=1 Tax=Stentor coeruleus TaxID=5963 RepID=A0A1R2BIT7_9CILI|nr:hypothetical protein SteCoe_23882 [Stentor coeruleus]